MIIKKFVQGPHYVSRALVGPSNVGYSCYKNHGGCWLGQVRVECDNGVDKPYVY